jgi:hypothetical protein
MACFSAIYIYLFLFTEKQALYNKKYALDSKNLSLLSSPLGACAVPSGVFLTTHTLHIFTNHQVDATFELMTHSRTYLISAQPHILHLAPKNTPHHDTGYLWERYTRMLPTTKTLDCTLGTSVHHPTDASSYPRWLCRPSPTSELLLLLLLLVVVVVVGYIVAIPHSIVVSST